MSDAMGT